MAKYVYQYVNFVFLINNITTVYPFFSFLADATETVLEEHQPTKVVRILEFESNVNVNNRNSKADIELWYFFKIVKLKILKLWTFDLFKGIAVEIGGMPTPTQR